MKCNSFLTLLLLSFSFSGLAQSSYGLGVFNVNVGVGFPNKTHAAIDAGNNLFSINGEENGTSTPFFNISVNYGVDDHLDLGIFAAYFKSDSEIISILSLLSSENFGKMEYSVFSVGGRATLHHQLFPGLDKIDTYASTFFGYNIVNDQAKVQFVNPNEEYFGFITGTEVNQILTDLVSNANFPEITYEVNAGAKYQLSDNVSIFGEAGYGRFLVNSGINFTFR